MQMKTNYDLETVALMARVCEDAFETLRTSHFYPTPEDEKKVRCDIANRVMAAVAAGERHSARLKAAALESIEA